MTKGDLLARGFRDNSGTWPGRFWSSCLSCQRYTWKTEWTCGDLSAEVCTTCDGATSQHEGTILALAPIKRLQGAA